MCGGSFGVFFSFLQYVWKMQQLTDMRTPFWINDLQFSKYITYCLDMNAHVYFNRKFECISSSPKEKYKLSGKATLYIWRLLFFNGVETEFSTSLFKPWGAIDTGIFNTVYVRQLHSWIGTNDNCNLFIFTLLICFLVCLGKLFYCV